VPTTNTELPAFLIDLLESCPAAGSGVNPWLYQVAKQLHVHMDGNAIESLLRAKVKRCGRRVGDGEIHHQVESARARAFRPKNPEQFAKTWGEPQTVGQDPTHTDYRSQPAASWPEPNFDLIKNISSSGYGLYDLWESSPLRFDDGESHAEDIIDVLFPDNPLLCVGKTAYQFATRRREIWRGRLAGCSFITPNPMLQVQGLTLDGKISEHCKSATASRIYLVIEFDFSEFARDGETLSEWAPLVQAWRAAGVRVLDATAALHRHLSEYLPLVAAVHSGGKSLHGWYPAFSHTDRDLRLFMRAAVRLGADKQLWVRSQFTRVPDGRRENGKAQTCYYLDPGKAVRSE
jgi:hypothetical protein